MNSVEQKVRGLRQNGICFRSLSRLLLAISLAPLPGYGQSGSPALTSIKDTVYKSDGTPATGSVVISWDSFLSQESKPVFGGTKTVTLNNGALLVALIPNTGATPAGTSYTVRYYQSGSVYAEEYWVVPTSTPTAPPSQPTVVPMGATGSNTYCYWVSAVLAVGETTLSPAGCTSTGHNTLSSNNFNRVTWTAVSGATTYRVFRTSSSTALFGTGLFLVANTALLTTDDQSGTLQSATIPEINTTDVRTLQQVRVTVPPTQSISVSAAQVTGTAIVASPLSTQTITAPASSGIPLQIRAQTGNSANLLNIFDGPSAPTPKSWFNASGAFVSSLAPVLSNFTSGSVLFAGNGGQIAENNSQFFWDSAAERLRVGPRTGFSTLLQNAINVHKHTFAHLNPPSGPSSSLAAFSQSDNPAAYQFGAYAVAESNHASGNRAASIGLEADAYHTGAGTVSDLQGLFAFADNLSGGNATRVSAISANSWHESSSTTNELSGLYLLSNGKSAGTVVNNYGIKIDNQSAGTNNWAIKTGLGKVEFGGALLAPQINNVRLADQFAGADAAAKINAACLDLPATGGIIDGRGLEGAQTGASDPFAACTRPAVLLLGDLTLTTTAQWKPRDNQCIVGTHYGSYAAPSDGGTIIKPSVGFSPSSVILFDPANAGGGAFTTGVCLRNVMIDMDNVTTSGKIALELRSVSNAGPFENITVVKQDNGQFLYIGKSANGGAQISDGFTISDFYTLSENIDPANTDPGVIIEEANEILFTGGRTKIQRRSSGSPASGSVGVLIRSQTTGVNAVKFLNGATAGYDTHISLARVGGTAPRHISIENHTCEAFNVCIKLNGDATSSVQFASTQGTRLATAVGANPRKVLLDYASNNTIIEDENGPSGANIRLTANATANTVWSMGALVSNAGANNTIFGRAAGDKLEIGSGAETAPGLAVNAGSGATFPQVSLRRAGTEKANLQVSNFVTTDGVRLCTTTECLDFTPSGTLQPSTTGNDLGATGKRWSLFADTGDFSTSITSPLYASAASDPADAGVIRLGNDEAIAAESSPAGTDGTLKFNSSEQWESNSPLAFEGDTVDGNKSVIAIADPSAARTFTLPDADSNPVRPATCSGTDKVSGISSGGVITCSADQGGSGSGGDSARVEDGDNAGTFTAMSDVDFDDSGDIDFQRSAGTPDSVSAVVRPNSVALTTDTTGNYVGSVADGAGIDGTASGEGAAYTPSLDLTELNSHTFGDNSTATITQTFDPTGATNPAWSYSNGVANLSAGTLQQAGTAVALQSVSLTAGNGLTGGGDLSSNRTFDIAVTAPIELSSDSVACSTCTTASNSQTLTNKTFDAEGTGNVLLFPQKIEFQAAGCDGTTAASAYDLPTSNAPSKSCQGTSPHRFGTLDFADGSALTASVRALLPSDWTSTGGVDIKYIWSSGSTSTNSAVWTVQTSCVADGEDVANPTYNTAQTVSDANNATANTRNSATSSGITMTGCAAGETLFMKIGRDPANASDTLAATALLHSIEITIRRQI